MLTVFERHVEGCVFILKGLTVLKWPMDCTVIFDLVSLLVNKENRVNCLMTKRTPDTVVFEGEALPHVKKEPRPLGRYFGLLLGT